MWKNIDNKKDTVNKAKFKKEKFSAETICGNTVYMEEAEKIYSGIKDQLIAYLSFQETWRGK